MSEFKQTATIRQTAERCKAENLGVSEWQLREWCKAGKLKHVTSGRNVLIYWPNLIRFLENGDESPEPFGTVTPIPEKLKGKIA